MALRFTTSALGGPELRRDLEALQVGLSRELAVLRRDAAEQLSRATAANTPFGPGPQSERDNLPHIRNTIAARATGVISTHPAALVHEFGGTIEPRGVPIRIPRREMAARALAENLVSIEQQLALEVEQLIASTIR